MLRFDYAKGVEHKRKQWESKYAKLDSTYLKDSETRVKSQLDAVKGKLAAAIELETRQNKLKLKLN
jgi:hypothetical protein